MPEPDETGETPPVAETAPEEGSDVVTPEEPQDTPAPKPTETVDFWKAKAQDWEKKSKANAKAADRLAAIEESQKSELQKAIERAEAAEGTLATLQTAQQISDWKTEIADSKEFQELTAEQRARIVKTMRGTSQEELLEHARDLKALLPQPRQPGSVPGEGRTMTPGTGDRRQRFADIIQNARQ